MRLAILTDTLLASLVLCNTARADQMAGAFELAVRSGYAIPLGQASGAGTNGSSNLDKLVSGVVPIWLDAGYRAPKAYVGAFFQYGIGFVSNGTSLSTQCSANGVSCTINILMFGVDAQYHFTPDSPFDPYIGLGLGYEILNFNFSSLAQSGSLSVNGWQFFNLQLGGDFRPGPNVEIGPFAMFSLAQYSDCSIAAPGSGGSCSIPQQAVHEWLTLGVRVAYDVHFEKVRKQDEPEPP